MLLVRWMRKPLLMMSFLTNLMPSKTETSLVRLNFGMMVQRSFPMIWDNATARYLPQREEGGAILQRVIVTDKDGVSHVFDYKMIETPDGWQIDGVNYVPAPDLSA